MKATKLGLLILILAFGSTVETAWQVRNHIGPSGFRWFMWGNRFQGPSWSFESAQTEAVPPATRLEIENAFGAVKIVAGAPGEVRINLRKVVYQPTQEKARAFADRVELQARQEGGALRVTTNRALLERSRSSAESEVGFETHFELTVPPGTPVRVADEHGAVEVSDVASAELSTSHDSVRVERVAGAAQVDLRHGDVRASAIKGDLKVTNHHGRVIVEDVDGHVTIDMEHGDVTASRVGSLVVKNAHGDVTAETVKGDLEVHTEHGAVRAVDVGGRAAVETSFQGATLERVKGDASAHTEHGAVSISDVGGAVDAQASFDDVAIARVGGPAVVVVSHGGVHGRDLDKGARVRASGDDVLLDGFRGPVDVEAERAGVRLVPKGAIEAEVKVTASHGAIDLEIPEGSRVALQASAEHGEVSTEVPGMLVTQVSAGKLAASLGGGGHAVMLSTTHGDVRLRGSAAIAATASVAPKTP